MQRAVDEDGRWGSEIDYKLSGLNAGAPEPLNLHLRLIDFVCHSTIGLEVMKKEKKATKGQDHAGAGCCCLDPNP